ncbi:YopX family protein [Paraprevotella xylaniphila]|uniref:YopX family protein n=1 Tax=Paraprevotella xylaniphila TaxID=454155 RepID=UPI001032EEE8|nr:YopX family protein [Paraprevotella xylaniphila]
MKRIRFRGKSLDSGKWMYGDLIENQGEYYIYHACTETTLSDEGNTITIVATKVQNETVGQYTGLQDRNGKEIYEGDIVEQIVTNGYDYGLISEVCFDNGVFGIKHKSYKDYVVSRFVYSSYWNDGHAHGTISYEYELKGNIYDNPDLLANHQ